jgi:porin
VEVHRETLDAQKTPPQFGVTGDWGGLRTRLDEAGVKVTGGLVTEAAWNPAGGERELVRDSSQVALGATADSERLFGLKGGTLQATLTYRFGRDLGQDAGLGVLQQVQEIFGRGRVVRLTQLWYEQTFSDDAVALKLGRATVGEDFANFSCYFQNLSFCGSQPGNLVGDYWFNWPISQWMARLRVNHGDFHGQAGIYEVNPSNLDEDFTIGNLNGADGVLTPFELAWTPKFGPEGMRGSYKIGAWNNTAGGGDVFLDVNGQPLVLTGLAPLQRSARYGAWINIQQQLFGTVKDGNPYTGLAVFLNATQADRATSAVDNQISAGLFWKGIVARSPKDALGIAVARTHVNDRVRRGQQVDPARPDEQTSEYATEVYYSFHPWEGVELRPNFQYVYHPGGREDADAVVVIGLKAGLTL